MLVFLCFLHSIFFKFCSLFARLEYELEESYWIERSKINFANEQQTQILTDTVQAVNYHGSNVQSILLAFATREN